MAYNPLLESGYFDASGEWVMGRSREQQAQDEAMRALNAPGASAMSTEKIQAMLQNGTAGYDSSGYLWALNPSTGQPEQLRRGFLNDMTNESGATAEYYFASDPNMSQSARLGPAQLGASLKDKQDFQTGAGLTKMGLAAMTGGAVGGAMAGAGYSATAAGAGGGAAAGASRNAMAGENIGEGALVGGAMGGAGGYLYGGGTAYDPGAENMFGYEAGAGSSSLGGTSGGGMWELAEGGDWGAENMFAAEGVPSQAFSSPDWVNQLLAETGEAGIDASALEGGFNAAGSNAPWYAELPTSAQNAAQYGGNALRSGLDVLRRLVGGSSGKPGTTAGRGILDSIFNDPFGSAFNMTPFALALIEGNRQKNDIRDVTNQVQGLVDEASTANVQDMVLNPYDRETAAGRRELLTSLGNRKVLGSSFGNQDLTAYDTTRRMGRGDLATRALMGSIGTRGALLDQVLRGTNTMNTNKNLLLGAGLHASGRLFDRPSSNPFGLTDEQRNALNALFQGVFGQ
jgi:hypothetical protein